MSSPLRPFSPENFAEESKRATVAFLEEFVVFKHDFEEVRIFSCISPFVFLFLCIHLWNYNLYIFPYSFCVLKFQVWVPKLFKDYAEDFGDSKAVLQFVGQHVEKQKQYIKTYVDSIHLKYTENTYNKLRVV